MRTLSCPPFIMPLMPLHIVLVHPEIHWNTGNIGRTALAVGATLHLIEPLGFSLDEREVRRAGLDYWQHVDIRVWQSWEQFEKLLPELGQPWFFSAEAPRTLWQVELGGEDSVILVFGRETTGLPEELRIRHRDRLLSLPMTSPLVRSLNLSTAVAVGAYEALRQRRMATGEGRR